MIPGAVKLIVIAILVIFKPDHENATQRMPAVLVQALPPGTTKDDCETAVQTFKDAKASDPTIDQIDGDCFEVDQTDGA